MKKLKMVMGLKTGKLLGCGPRILKKKEVSKEQEKYNKKFGEGVGGCGHFISD